MAGMAGANGRDGTRDRAVGAAVIAAGCRLRAAGLVAATEGNLSVRIDAGRLLITPSGRRKDELSGDDLVVVDVVTDETTAPSPATKPSSDIAIHRAIYGARRDVNAVVHAHLPASMGLTLAGEVPDPSALPETRLFLGSVPFLAFGEPGSAELADRVAAALGIAGEDGRLPVVVLLERHGAVGVGAGDAAAAISQAVDRLELLEVLCRAWRDALLIRAARAAIGPSQPV
jgi:L-fuculose-phosphate aldolase